MLTASYVLGWCLGALSLALMIPAFYASFVGEREEAAAFINSAAGLFFLAGGLVIALHQRKIPMGRRQQLLVVMAVWFLLPFAAAIPYYLMGLPDGFVSCYFEAISGFTTTGFSLLDELSDIPKSVILWRALLQWLEGLTTLLVLSFIIGRLMGAELFGRDTRSIIQSNSGSSVDFENTLLIILPLYLELTFLCFILLVLFHIPLFDAFCLALSTLSTGGYMPRAGSFSLYGSPLAELTLAIFMFLGAVSIIWVRALIKRNWTILARTHEPIWIGFLILSLGLIFSTVILMKSSSPGLLTIVHSITIGLAGAASLITTTGFVFGNPDQIVLPYLLLLIFALIGGGRYSTAGGLKLSRVLTMFDLSRRELRDLLYPHGVHPTLYGNKSRDQHLSRSIWSIFSITILFLVFMMLALSYMGVPLNAALMASVSSFSNFGPAYDLLRPEGTKVYPTISSMGQLAQFLLSVGMIVGRMETLIILGFLNVSIWRK